MSRDTYILILIFIKIPSNTDKADQCFTFWKSTWLDSFAVVEDMMNKSNRFSLLTISAYLFFCESQVFIIDTNIH